MRTLWTDKKGFSTGGILFVALFIAVISWLLLPHYFAEIEKKQSMSMQILLIHATVAQDKYYELHRQYTDQWEDLLPFMRLPAGMTVWAEEVPDNPSDYFFSFISSKRRARTDGFIVSLHLTAEEDSGVITAIRMGSVRHHYELLRPFPQGITECLAEGHASIAFCRFFLKEAHNFELKKIFLPSKHYDFTETVTITEQNIVRP